MTKHIIGLWTMIVVLFLIQCKEDRIRQENIKVSIPQFNAQNAYDHIQKQVEFGPRLVGLPGHSQCKAYLSGTLASYGFTVTEMDFTSSLYDGRKVTGTNIMARYNSDVIERVLLAGHWDTRHIADKDSSRQEEPIVGADDGASGPAVLLEIARLVQQNPIPMGVDIVLFDLEDHGDPNGQSALSWGLGSQEWSKWAKKVSYEAKYAIVASMVGAENARFTVEGLTAASALKKANSIWDLAIGMSRGKYFKKIRTENVVDDHRFIFQALGLPVVYVSNRPENSMFGNYHHTHRDNMEIISKETLNAVGQVLTATIYRESNKDL